MKVICIPYLGGTAAAFNGLINEATNQIEIVALDYAGHGCRRGEPFYRDFSAMIEDVSEQINHLIGQDEDYGLLGYSLGALVAYEVLRQNKLSTPPIVTFFAAQVPPHLFAPLNVTSTMEDEEFVKIVIENGWVNDKLLSQKRFWPFLLRTLREDLRIRETYKSEPQGTPFNTDLCILYNRQDIDATSAIQWKEYTKKQCHFIEIGSTHMFLHTHPKEIIDAIQSNLI